MEAGASTGWNGSRGVPMWKCEIYGRGGELMCRSKDIHLWPWNGVYMRRGHLLVEMEALMWRG